MGRFNPLEEARLAWDAARLQGETHKLIVLLNAHVARLPARYRLAVDPNMNAVRLDDWLTKPTRLVTFHMTEADMAAMGFSDDQIRHAKMGEVISAARATGEAA
jgi:hypothetical protein